MNATDWRTFFQIASRVLGPGDRLSWHSKSWCAWTTFGRLGIDSGYWTGGLPSPEDIFETYVGDGGGPAWTQPFDYADLAHIIIPREFMWETAPSPSYENGTRVQDLDALSQELTAVGIAHRTTELLLEIKCY